VSTETGPFFDGRAQAAVGAFAGESEELLAREGRDLVLVELASVLQNPTGYYESKVRADDDRVTDDNVVYGPWLEGTGSRNDTTRFKGYATFRRVGQRLQADAVRRVEPLFKSKYLGRLS
jgi:hypothetical protein